MSNTDIVEEIKSKLDIVTLTSEYLELKKSGRNFKALCPFHKESSPSFMISPQKQLAYCFGCQKGGDVFKFIMEIERLDFPEAVKYLAEKAGISYTPSESSSLKKTEKDHLYEILAKAASFFEERLQENPHATEYVKKRLLQEGTVKKFQVGFAPASYDDLWKYLKDKEGYTTEDILKVGLLTLNETKYYNKFRDRIMFPITNHMGYIVGFGGRTLENIDPKYLNSPETPVYHKSNVLYGFSFAKDAIKELDSVYIVEGYMDFLSAWQAGIYNVVASSGTALTKEQVQLLKRYTKNFYFLFDNDNAGWQATLRNAEVAIPLEIDVKPLSLKDFDVKDIDEFLQKNGKADLDKLTEEGKTFHDFVRIKLLEKFDKNSLEGKKRIVHLYLPLLKLLPSPMEQEHYIRQLAYELMISEDAIKKELQKLRTPKIHENVSSSLFTTSHFLTPDAIFIGILLTFPELYSEIESQIYFTELDDELSNHVYKLMKNEYTFSGDIAHIRTLLPEDVKTRIDVLLLYLDEANILQSIHIARSTLTEKISLLHKKFKDKLLLQLAFYQKEKDTSKWNETFALLSKLR